MKIIRLYILASFLLVNLSYADSSCWPEEKLIGTSAIGFIKNFDVKTVATSSLLPFDKIKKECKISAYKLENSRLGKLISCDQICYIHGECGINAEYPLLAFYEVVGSNFKIKLKSSEYIWLRFTNPPDTKWVLSKGQIGRLYPLISKLYKHPNGIEIKPPNVNNIAYKFIKVIKPENEEWVQVKGFQLLSDQPPVKLGKELISGYFLYRDKNKNLKAVLSDIWCD